ncbi:ATPase associated with various cellular activities AAA_3 [Solidesulfovibrio fructosivorans JJ]]|uniref:ATPase associated with various cellular activities AAA_3 n=1 Tax=Solidesulfovibrio fructosivorans JJ] TaxID=596151 RepID=E1JYZ1_SOLFR|nr:MoxR family ATPase [Solidesulfovibrio fructosivorans]EFL50407.1 ATPase associated with various cellular activities AAA_3 [Solidesulfovibrio fructosivorans JJ]]
MIPSQIATALETLFPIRQPAFLWGPPGVGKSRIVAQTAARLDLPLTDIRAVLLDPVDLRGLPHIGDDGRTHWRAPAFLPREGRGVLFLDELNAAPPLVQAACYQLILDRSLGEYRLPDGWTVIAAGNRDQDRAVTHRMPTALANRFVHLDVAPDLDDWVTWAKTADIAPEVVAFLRFRPSLLHDFDPSRETRSFPSPRSWEFVSNMLGATRDGRICRELFAGAIGEGAAVEFAGFLSLWRKLPDTDAVLAAPDDAPAPSEPAAVYAICEALGRRATPETMPALTRYAARLPMEFGVLLMRDAVRADSATARTEAFAAWARDNAEVFA